MFEIWGIRSSYKTFWTISQLNGNFKGLFFRMKHGIQCATNYNGSPASSQNDMNFGPQTASNWTAILHTLRKFCILFHCQASQTDPTNSILSYHRCHANCTAPDLDAAVMYGVTRCKIRPSAKYHIHHRCSLPFSCR